MMRDQPKKRRQDFPMPEVWYVCQHCRRTHPDGEPHRCYASGSNVTRLALHPAGSGDHPVTPAPLEFWKPVGTWAPFSTTVVYPPPCQHVFSSTIYVYDAGRQVESYQVCGSCGMRKTW
jgi:hypothetical protein